MKQRNKWTAKDLEHFLRENPDWCPYADLVVYPPLAEEMMKEFDDISPEALSRCMELVTEGGGWVTRGAIYIRVRREEPRRDRDGDKWATMLCLNAFPGVRTTDTFWAGRKSWVDVYGEEYANDVKKRLAKKGVNLKAGDEYMPELAEYRGDPKAVVPFGGARSHIKKVCEERGWACEGAVTTNHREPEYDPLADENCVPLAEDIIRTKARNMHRRNPEVFKGKTREEARQMVLDKYARKK